MIVSRSFSRLILSRSTASLICSLPAAAFSTSAHSTQVREESSESKPDHWETVDEFKIQISKKAKCPSAAPSRLAEIPWQVKVANAVQLIGNVGAPVKLVKGKDGSTVSVALLLNDKSVDDPPHLWIPLVFRGDLADVAAYHLKKNDTVYVTGQLGGDAVSSLEFGGMHSNLQVIVQSLSFVQELSSKKISQLGEGVTPREQEMFDPGLVHDVSLKEKSQLGEEVKFRKSRKPSDCLWEDLIANPKQWLDCRMSKQSGSVNRKYPDFRQKNTGEGLWVGSAPDSVSKKLNNLTFSMLDNNAKDVTSLPSSKSKTAKFKKSGKPSDCLWEDLVANPKQWLDCRMSKQIRSVNPKYPDFKHKNTGEGLWVNSALYSVSKKLNNLTFAMPDENVKEVPSWSLSKSEKDTKSLECQAENPKFPQHNRKAKLERNFQNFKENEIQNGILDLETPDGGSSKPHSAEN